MIVIEKNAILKVRVTDDVQSDFLAVCEALGRTPAAVLRELIEGHVATHSIYFEDDVRVTVERPAGYDYGAWRVRMTLRSLAAMEFMGDPVPFRIPQLKERRICSDKGYRVATVNWDGRGSGLDGIFVDGVWEGDVHCNGVAEDDNATSIDSVVAALKAAVRDQVQARMAHGQCR